MMAHQAGTRPHRTPRAPSCACNIVLVLARAAEDTVGECAQAMRDAEPCAAQVTRCVEHVDTHSTVGVLEKVPPAFARARQEAAIAPPIWVSVDLRQYPHT